MAEWWEIPSTPRGIGDRFRDSYIDAASRAEIGGAAMVSREVLKRRGMTEAQINAALRRIQEQAARKNAADPAIQGQGFDKLAPANIGRLVVDLAGGMLGGVDPTYVIAPGRGPATRIVGQAIVNASENAASQKIQQSKGIRDDFDWGEVGFNAAAGAAFQGAGEAGRKAKTSIQVRKARQDPRFPDLVETIVDLEGGGTLAKPKTSPKGAMGVMQVMPDTARKPGFGIDPWDGKSQKDLKRVGEQYAAAMHRKYDGDPIKVLAAYNAGPGRVDAAVKKHGDNWLTHMPDETVNYVRKGGDKLLGKKNPKFAEFKASEERWNKASEDYEAGRLPEDEYDRILADHDKILDEYEANGFDDIMRQADDSDGFSIAEQYRGQKQDPLGNSLEEGQSIPSNEYYRDMEGRDEPMSYYDWLDQKYEEGHQEWVDKNFDEGQTVVGYGANINERGEDITGQNVTPFPTTRAVEPNPRGKPAEVIDFEAARDAKDDAEHSAMLEGFVKEADANYWNIRHLLDAVVKGNPHQLNKKKIADYIDNIDNALYHAHENDSRELVNILEDTKEVWRQIGLHLGTGREHNSASKFIGRRDAPPEYRHIQDRIDELDDLYIEANKRGDKEEARRIAIEQDNLMEREKRIEADRTPVNENKVETEKERITREAIEAENAYEAHFNRRDDNHPEFANKNSKRYKEWKAKEEELLAKKESTYELLKRLFKDDSGELRGDGEGRDESDLPEAVHILRRALKSAESLPGRQRKLYKEARKEKLQKAVETGKYTSGEKGFYAEKKAFEGSMPKVDFSPIRHEFKQEQIDDLFNMVKNNIRLSFYDKVTARSGLAKVMGAEGGAVPTARELELLGEVFPKDVIQGILKNREFKEKLAHHVANALNLPRAIMSSMDASAPLRQGVFLIGRKEFYPAFAEMFKYLAKPKYFEAAMDEIYSRPTYQMMRKAGLSITKTDGPLSAREEDFMSNLPEKIPLLNVPYKASQRAYTGFLNKLRADTFDNLVRLYDEAGIQVSRDMKKMRHMAEYVNAATGRGKLQMFGKNFEQAAPLLNAAFFSPRLISSRLTMLNPAFYAKLDPVVRKEAMKSLVSFSLIATTVLSLAAMAGADVETDPRSSDFAKIKVGNTRFDVLGGFQQYLRFFAQVATGEVKKPDGSIQELGKGYKNDTRLDKTIDFGRSKLSPVASYVGNALDGKNMIGEEVTHPKAELDLVQPLYVQDLKEAMELYGAKGLLTGVPAIFGVGVQTYKPREKKEKQVKSENWWENGTSETSKKSESNWWEKP